MHMEGRGGEGRRCAPERREVGHVVDVRLDVARGAVGKVDRHTLADAAVVLEVVDGRHVGAQQPRRPTAVVAAVAQPEDAEQLRRVGVVGVARRNRVELARPVAGAIEGDDDRKLDAAAEVD